MQRIKDILLEEIKAGKNWKVKLPNDLNTPFEEWEVEPEEEFSLDDRVAYSAVFVSQNDTIMDWKIRTGIVDADRV